MTRGSMDAAVTLVTMALGDSMGLRIIQEDFSAKARAARRAWREEQAELERQQKAKRDAPILRSAAEKRARKNAKRRENIIE